MVEYGSLPELLAPAGSMDALRAAVAAGADAVYLSGKRFGARQYAANFTREELSEAIRHCHARGVRVYVTVNVLVRDDELVEVAETLLGLYEAGVDAIIIQDIGVAALARRIVPDLPLHASTQMTIHNMEGVRWAASFGFERVVLARELSLDEVTAIDAGFKEHEIGLEVFVHGAICYSYSGQCLFSSMIGGRSGNRGMCAQPCRKRYLLLKGASDHYGRPAGLKEIPFEKHYLLSPRDLAVYPRLDEVVRAPVCSLKIEGRMKSPEYVATVVSTYRRALDAIARGSWLPGEDEVIDLLLAFNREFTGGYLLGEAGSSLMGQDRPDNRGVRIGEVTAFSPSRREATVSLNGRVVPQPGDGIAFASGAASGERFGMELRGPVRHRKGVLQIRVPRSVTRGDIVLLTRRKSLDSRAKRLIEGREPVLRPLRPVDLEVWWCERVPVIRARTEDMAGTEIVTEVRGEIPMEIAVSSPLSAEQIAVQLRKAGGSPFTVRTLDLRYPGGLFSPLREINHLRRKAFASLEQQLLSHYCPPANAIAAARGRWADMRGVLKDPGERGANHFSRPPTLSLYASDPDSVEAGIEGGCARIYFEPWLAAEVPGTGDGELLAGILSDAASLCEGRGELIWKWPRITTRDFFTTALPLLERMSEWGVKGVMVESSGAAEAVRAVSPSLPLYGSTGLNVFNHMTASVLGETFRLLTLSPELSASQMALLIRHMRTASCSPSLELIVQGPAEMVVSEDCLPLTVLGSAALEESGPGTWWGIRDEKNYTFPVVIDSERRTHILNPVELSLIDQLPLLFDTGCDGCAIDARWRTERYAREMSRLYSDAIGAVAEEGVDARKRLDSLKKKARDRSIGGITTGHFLRGLRDE